MDLKRLTIICGHYGTGKTNLSVNLAIDAARSGKDVTLIDMDVVNPYFRSADHKEMLEGYGVRVIAPAFANTNVDIPAIPEGAMAALEGELVIIDVGGDDAGATVLGGFSEKIKGMDYDMWYVVNRYRSMVSDVESSVRMLREIETACRLNATGVVNNSHLKEQTTVTQILGSMDYAERTAELAGLPLKFTTCPKDVSKELSEIGFLYPVDIYVKTPWESEGE